MVLRAYLLAMGLALALFGAIGVVAPGEAFAHPGHEHTPTAARSPAPTPILAAEETQLANAADDFADGRCWSVCCVGAGCCPSTLATQVDPTPPSPSAVELLGFHASARPNPEAAPPPEPPRSFT